MYLSEITLQNFKGIKNLNLALNPGVNLIIGNNGAGKTSLLNGISVALSNMLRLIPVTSFVNIEQSDVYAETTRMGDVTSSTEYHTPVQVKALFKDEDTVYACEFVKQTEVSTTDVVVFPALEYMKNLVEQKLPLPLLNYQNAGRGSSVAYDDKTIYGVQATKRNLDRLAGYMDSFAKTMNFYEIQAWCMQMELITIQKKKLIREYSLFKQMISSFIQAIENKSATSDVYYSFDSSSLVYVDGNRELPFYNLSAGYQNVLCMAMELAYRSAVLNPDLADAKDTEGIVLIDEIEMHLHPAWQWKIVDALKNTFPKVQFIISTHSPIVLSSAKDSSLYLMKSVNEIMALANVFGYKISDILMHSQGSTDIPEEISAWYDKVEKLLDAGDAAGLESLQADVAAAYGNDSQVAKSINDFIEVNRNGRIYTSPVDDTMEHDINEVLKLNGLVDKNSGVILADTATSLVLGRKSVYRNYVHYIKKLAGKNKLSRSVLERKINDIETAATYVEYAGVWLYLLKRKLRELVSK